MRQPKELSDWDFIDTHMEPDGYDMKTVVEFTSRNFQQLIDEHNNLVEVVNMLCEKLGIIPHDD